MAFQKMSESVYVAMCRKIGTQQQVAVRREINDIDNWFLNQVENRARKCVQVVSGSQKEGFRLEGSDIDIMEWYICASVIWDFHQYKFYNKRRQVLFVCDGSVSPPGFTLLLLFPVGYHQEINAPCVKINENIYLSSSRFRKMKSDINSLTMHGPCLSGKTLNSRDFDIAICLASDFWPPSAISWIDRCRTWPPISVVNDIVRNGCHFVPIGHKLGNHADNEWRISFSQAEAKLVYSMSHTQFLTYGLLKLFLKEIINEGLKDEDKLLCSYHVKTTVFWAIQQNALSYWCPQNLLACFWVCFKLLLKWVYNGVCPNFFIPQNNMFLGKIHGKTQTHLFRRLYDMYKMGIALLLESPSIRSSTYDVLCNPKDFIQENCPITKDKLDASLFGEIKGLLVSLFLNQRNLQKCLHLIEQMICEPLTRCKVAYLQKTTSSIFHCIAFTIPNKCTDSTKREYVVDKMIHHMLRLAAKFTHITELLFISMYYYKTCRYRKALSVIEDVRGIGLSRNVPLSLNNQKDIHFIDELIPEQLASRQNWLSVFMIPTSVLIYMLEFLCSRHVDTMRAQAALNDLQAEVNLALNYDSFNFGEISWEILGICQQIAGYHQSALYSYQQSLRQYPITSIKTATRKRIRDLQI